MEVSEEASVFIFLFLLPSLVFASPKEWDTSPLTVLSLTLFISWFPLALKYRTSFQSPVVFDGKDFDKVLGLSGPMSVLAMGFDAGYHRVSGDRSFLSLHFLLYGFSNTLSSRHLHALSPRRLYFISFHLVDFCKLLHMAPP